MVGEPVTKTRERKTIASPQGKETKSYLLPITEGVGDLKVDDAVSDEVVVDAAHEWEELADKYDELAEEVEKQFENESGDVMQQPPMAKPQPKPTEAEWERHEFTHILYAAWCPHCVAPRAIRHEHPRKEIRPIVIQDSDGSNSGPVKISMDYMYPHESSSPNKELADNPPHPVAVEHRHGRVCAHRVFSTIGEAEWIPKRIIQDLNNNAVQDVI